MIYIYIYIYNCNWNPSKCDDAKKVFFYRGWPAALEQQFREPTADFISGDYIR